MQPPQGPHRIAKNGQVVLPRETLRAADLAPGDSVYFLPNDDPPGTILVIPYELAAQWFEAGRRASEGEPAQEDHTD